MTKRIITFLSLLAMPFWGIAQQVNSQQLLRDVEALSADSLQGRLTGSAGNHTAQLYILDRFQQLRLRPFNGSYVQPFELNSSKLPATNAANLVGYIPGKSDKVIVLTAHYDHVGMHAGQVYNGADDNASGVGGLLAIATYFARHKPMHTLVFAALDAEEQGLQGARAFLENPPMPLSQILLNVNMDMLSINSKGELYASGVYHTPQLLEYLQQVEPLPEARLALGHDQPAQGHNDWTSQSDHYEFHKRGIPFVYFGVEDHPHYHQPTDDFKNINPVFYPDAVQLILNFVQLIDKNAGKLTLTK
ncbi:M28 family peptidase [Pontibacter sp. CAU 1760]